MGDGFWSRPPAPNYVSTGIIKRPHAESDVNLPREPLTIGTIHYVPKTDAHIALNAANVLKSPSPRRDAAGNLARGGLAMEPQCKGNGSKTLLVEGLLRNFQDQNVVYDVFRPFDGFEQVRPVNEDPDEVSGSELCYVDFVNVTCAMAAVNALQGFKVDPSDPASSSLVLQFAPSPGGESP